VLPNASTDSGSMWKNAPPSSEPAARPTIGSNARPNVAAGKNTVTAPTSASALIPRPASRIHAHVDMIRVRSGRLSLRRGDVARRRRRRTRRCHDRHSDGTPAGAVPGTRPGDCAGDQPDVHPTVVDLGPHRCLARLTQRGVPVYPSRPGVGWQRHPVATEQAFERLRGTVFGFDDVDERSDLTEVGDHLQMCGTRHVLVVERGDEIGLLGIRRPSLWFGSMIPPVRDGSRAQRCPASIVWRCPAWRCVTSRTASPWPWLQTTTSTSPSSRAV